MKEKIETIIFYAVKGFIALLFIAILTILIQVSYADDRADFSRSAELSDRYSDRIETAAANIDYTPAIQEDVSRDLTILADRNARDRYYFPDERWTEGRNAALIAATSDKPIPSSAELRELVLRNAIQKAPNLIERRLNAYPNTFVWYLWNDFETQSISDAAETISTIIKINN